MRSWRAGTLAAAAFVAAVAVVGISVANAASLTVNAGAVSVASVGPCSGAAWATATAATGSGTSYTGVSITVPSGCAGLTVNLVVLNGTTSLASGSYAVATNGVTTVPVGSYTASSTLTVQATVDGWNLPTTWAPPAAVGPIVAGNAQTVLSPINWTISNNNQACAQVTVTTTTANAWWRVNLNVNQAPFYGATSGYQLTEGKNQLDFDPASGTPVNGILGIHSSNPGHGRLSPGTTRTFTVCNYSLPNPPDVPSAYSVTYSQGEWTDTKACVQATITGNGASEYYVGWRAQIDMTSAFQRIQSTGRVVRAVRPQTGSDGNIVTFSPALSVGASSFQASNAWQGVVRLSESRTVGVCASEY